MKPERPEIATDFAHRPLDVLRTAFPAAGRALWLAEDQLVLGDATASRAVLANEQGLYREHSDFFQSRHGLFGPRAVQEEIGRRGRDLLREHHRTHRESLPALIDRHLAPQSDWPDAGNWLLFRYFEPVLAGPESGPELAVLLERIVERAVLAGARDRTHWLGRAFFRRRVARTLRREITGRRERLAATGPGGPDGEGAPRDIVDVVVRAARPEASPAELGEIFLSFLFAMAGSVGFLLGWCLHLLGTHPETDTEPAWVVREALRLWPVAWLLDRRPAVDHEMAGERVTPDDEVIVCPYALHRSSRYWKDPDRFVPERWADAPSQEAFLPFGWGPHRCTAAALSMLLVEEILTVLRERYRTTVLPRGTEPTVAAALAPPPFELVLERRTGEPADEALP